MLAEIAGEDIADGVEIGAAVMRDDALGIARRARGVAQRNGVPFVGGPPCPKFGSPCATAASYSIAPMRFPRQMRHRRRRSRTALCPSSASALPRSRRKIRIDQNDLCPPWSSWNAIEGASRRMLSAFSTAPAIGTAKCSSFIAGMFRQHGRDRVAVADAAAREPGRKATAASVSLRPGKAAAFIDRAEMIGVNRSGARQEAQRRQRHVIGRRLVQSDAVLVLTAAHRFLPRKSNCRFGRYITEPAPPGHLRFREAGRDHVRRRVDRRQADTHRKDPGLNI